MNSPKINTQNNSRTKIKNLSTVLAMLLAMVTLFQASADNNAKVERKMSTLEVKALTEIESFLFDNEEMTLEESIIEEFEAQEMEGVKVFDSEGNLVASGDLEGDSTLRNLVNQADYLSSFGGQQYYRIAE